MKKLQQYWTMPNVKLGLLQNSPTMNIRKMKWFPTCKTPFWNTIFITSETCIIAKTRGANIPRKYSLMGWLLILDTQF